MRVRAIYSFYLNYMLPRIDNKEPITVKTTIDDCDAAIATRGAQDPLFPTDVDKTLSSTMIALTPLVRPEAAILYQAQRSILDRISVELEWEQDELPADDPSFTDSYLVRAVALANAILEHVRVACNLVDVKKIARSWDSSRAAVTISAPHTQIWEDAESGAALPVFSGMNSLGSTEGIRIGPVPTTSLKQLTTTLTGDGPPPLYLSLLMDAEASLLTLSIREATLYIASACETRANIFAEEQAIISKNRVKGITSTPNSSFATRYYHLLPQEVRSRSFQADSSIDFDLIDEAYRERNKLIHTGQFSAKLPELERARKVAEWLASARKAVAWFDSIATSSE